MDSEFDVIVVGAGPGGSTCTHFLSKAGLKVLLLDRATFPRDKICGDASGGRSSDIIAEMGIMDQMLKTKEQKEIYGISISSPNQKMFSLTTRDPKTSARPEFICPREVFDNVLFKNAKKHAAKTLEGFFAEDLIIENGKVLGVRGKIDGKSTEFRAKIVVGADGSGGITARKVGAFNDDPVHQSAAVRAYYKNVEGLTDKIELHFVEESMPGYFWIFPLPNKRANVGLGMVVKEMRKKKINLQKTMLEILNKNPLFKDRFLNAKRIGEVKSWLLPMGSRHMKIYGEGYVLIGDAASLIDPFSGDGVGNAMLSGKIASKVIVKAIKEGDVSEKRLSEYDKMLFEKIGDELKTNYKLQKLANNRFLLNLVVGKAQKSEYVRNKILSSISGERNAIMDPIFILRVLLA